MYIVFFILIGILLILGILAILLMKKITILKKIIEDDYSDIKIHLKRKYELIPNIISIIRHYASHEETLFMDIIDRRANAISARIIKEKNEHEPLLNDGLEKLITMAKNYPDILSDPHFIKLQSVLDDIQKKIFSLQKKHNNDIHAYNTKIALFPYNLLMPFYGQVSYDYAELQK